LTIANSPSSPLPCLLPLPLLCRLLWRLPWALSCPDKASSPCAAAAWICSKQLFNGTNAPHPQRSPSQKAGAERGRPSTNGGAANTRLLLGLRLLSRPQSFEPGFRGCVVLLRNTALDLVSAIVLAAHCRNGHGWRRHPKRWLISGWRPPCGTCAPPGLRRPRSPQWRQRSPSNRRGR
jgi:hypothetical protein